MNIDHFLLALNVFAFVWGAIWGSFLNVVIYRLPEGLSLVRPPSRCPKCKAQLAWYDNVPILGWMILRGRCRYCKLDIPVRYPLVELLTAILSLSLWIHVSHGRLDMFAPDGPALLELGMAFFLYFYLITLLISIAFIDWDRTIIPHELTGLAAVLGVVTAFVMPQTPITAEIWPMITWFDALIGGLVGGGAIWGIIQGYALLRGIQGMGWGDFTLMGVCGLWLGWRGVVVVLFLASIQALIFTLGHAIQLRLRGKKLGDSGFLIEDINAVDTWDGTGGEPEPESASEGENTDETAAQPAEDPQTPSAPDDATTNTPEVLPKTADATPVSGSDTADSSAPTDTEEETDFGQLAIPFGPFIALAAIEYLLLGQFILPWLLF